MCQQSDSRSSDMVLNEICIFIAQNFAKNTLNCQSSRNKLRRRINNAAGDQSVEQRERHKIGHHRVPLALFFICLSSYLFLN